MTPENDLINAVRVRRISLLRVSTLMAFGFLISCNCQNEEEYKVGFVFKENLLFQFDGSQLLSSSFDKLDSLANIFNKHPNLKIEIGIRTNAGSDRHGATTLTENRANSVKNYLVEIGIQPDRLIPKGYGHISTVNGERSRVLDKDIDIEFKVIQLMKN